MIYCCLLAFDGLRMTLLRINIIIIEIIQPTSSLTHTHHSTKTTPQPIQNHSRLLKKYQQQINLQTIQIMKSKTKLTNNLSRQKLMPPRPRPQFTTDFIDRDKYKLSETEMVQKKAALQSKHRQQAIEQLQERRKKLQMGIIDDDTRKVYETALTSKKIDLNPSIRKNLSQMIQYQKQKQRQICKNTENDEQEEKEQGNDHQEGYEKQLKEAQAFIKKFQRAKKMDKIQRAVNLLSDDNKSSSLTKPSPKAVKSKSRQKKPIFQNPAINSNILNLKESNVSMNTSTNQQILSNIEDTIRFMEERLFSAGRIDKLKKQQKRSQTLIDSKEQTHKSYSDLPSKANQSNTSYDQNTYFYKQTLEISHLKVKEDESDDENQCLDTIRRMKEMIDSKESIPEHNFKKNMKENVDFANTTKHKFDGLSTVQKITPHYAQSDAEIDFSLTMNNSQANSLLHSSRDKPNDSACFGKMLKQQNEDDEYQRIKKSLFEQVNRLKLNNIDNSEEHSFQAKTHQKHYQMIDQSSIPNVKFVPTPSPVTNKKQKKSNAQLQRLRNQINGTKSSVEAIKVEALPSSRNQIIGIDFRGSFNIKKNIQQ